MGWRMMATRLPVALSAAATARVVCDLPHPVRTAQMATTGFDDGIMVASGPWSLKSAPAASAREARCITVSWLTSL